MRQNVLVQNRKIPHWAKLLQSAKGENAVFHAASLSDLPKHAIYDPHQSVDIRSEAMFIQNCSKLTNNPYFALEAAFGDQYAKQISGYVFKYSRTLGEGLKAGAKFLPVVDPTMTLTLSKKDENCTLEIHCSDGYLVGLSQHREFMIFAILGLFRAATKTNLTPVEIRFQHRKANTASEIERLAGCPINFGCRDTALVLNARALDLPLVSADENLLRVLVSHGNTLLEQRSNETPNLVGQIEKLLVDGLPQKLMDADDVAAELGISRRTLSRRLSDLGSSFRNVSEEVRKNLAKTYLKDPSFALAEIAFLLSFSDQAGFTTAFKRWSGQTPKSFRGSITTFG